MTRYEHSIFSDIFITRHNYLPTKLRNDRGEDLNLCWKYEPAEWNHWNFATNTEWIIFKRHCLLHWVRKRKKEIYEHFLLDSVSQAQYYFGAEKILFSIRAHGTIFHEKQWFYFKNSSLKKFMGYISSCIIKLKYCWKLRN